MYMQRGKRTRHRWDGIIRIQQQNICVCAGRHIRIFGEGPDAAAGDIEIKYCPMCGRKLDKSIMPMYDLELASKRAHIRFA